MINLDRKNIVLIGMPASGKSTVGVILAKAVEKDFCDTDILIQKKEGRSLQDIINRDGNEIFSQIERKILSSYSPKNTVVATGGSAVYYEEVMEHFRKDGLIVYIKVDLTEIMRRLDNIETRGVVLEKGQTLEHLYALRCPLYEKESDIVIEATSKTVEETVEAIIQAMKRNLEE